MILRSVDPERWSPAAGGRPHAQIHTTKYVVSTCNPEELTNGSLAGAYSYRYGLLQNSLSDPLQGYLAIGSHPAIEYCIGSAEGKRRTSPERARNITEAEEAEGVEETEEVEDVEDVATSKNCWGIWCPPSDQRRDAACSTLRAL